MKRIIITLLLFPQIILTAQKTQTYSGAFENGTAIYQYYENDNYERIYHGSFNFNNGVVRGYFKNNKRDSIWIFSGNGTYARKNYKYLIKGKFKNGKLDGQWQYTKTDISTNKIIQASKANFVNGIISGDYEYIDNRPVAQYGDETKISIKGKYDNEGFYDSVWTIKYMKDDIDFERILKYKNGFLYWSLDRNLATGEISKYDKTDILSIFDLIMLNYKDLNMDTEWWDKKGFSIKIENKKYVFTETVDKKRINWEYAYCFWFNMRNERSNELYNYNFIKGFEIPDTYQERYFIQSMY